MGYTNLAVVIFGPELLFFLIVSSGPAQMLAPSGVTRTLRWACDGCKCLSFTPFMAPAERQSIYKKIKGLYLTTEKHSDHRWAYTVKISNNKDSISLYTLRFQKHSGCMNQANKIIPCIHLALRLPNDQVISEFTSSTGGRLEKSFLEESQNSTLGPQA